MLKLALLVHRNDRSAHSVAGRTVETPETDEAVHALHILLFDGICTIVESLFLCLQMVAIGIFALLFRTFGRFEKLMRIGLNAPDGIAWYWSILRTNI